MEDFRFSSTTLTDLGNNYDFQKQRASLFQLINGDAFYSLSQWPAWVKRLFWEKPMSDKGTFMTMLFLVGNGGSPELVKNWVALRQYWLPGFKKKAIN